MAKLATKDKFLDFSDYGRTAGTQIAQTLKNTRFTPIHVSLLFGVSGLIAIYCILSNHQYWACFFLILKSIIDAADGELARIRKTPSYTGRYLDSLLDMLLNFLILTAICFVSDSSFQATLLAFFCIELQGTLYNYYYVILRSKCKGADKTSQIFENKIPKAFAGESQKWVGILFKSYQMSYGVFDKIIQKLDYSAAALSNFPHWFMTLVSLYGLGFQLLLIGLMLAMGWTEHIIPFFIAYSLLIPVLIIIRKNCIKQKE
ncbi:CDP-alcohol phosphatidyltransferase family protein [Flavobacterium daejeonense]|uniref:CDP-alcohol phosphatidyltransferase family protein n=1 Tax=Flavobacterium daejeonense TaxID=350893 RepID=UPI00047ECAF7|nr:CDP-alcohol phosphatidyltransferase family protein [Flavobacterium daejeonense]